MATVYEEQIAAHASIYGNDNSNRKLRLQYALPERGTNRETGILFLIPAYGGCLDSSVYRKMRATFPDMYNLVVIQCDYFGIRYMGTETERMKDFFSSIISGERAEGDVLRMEETEADCNDMGLMQAADIIQAGLYVIHKLSRAGRQMNFGRILSYGSSHGSYLGYLINRLCPGLLKLIVDNSSYCIPSYLDKTRLLQYTVSDKLAEKYKQTFSIEVEYLIKRHRERFLPDAFYDLNGLYDGFDNRCMILAFHGKEDRMLSLEEKRRFLQKVPMASLIAITREDVDGKYFKSAEHGLGVDLLNLYEVIEGMTQQAFPYEEELNIPLKVALADKKNRIEINYEGLTPHITWEKGETEDVE